MTSEAREGSTAFKPPSLTPQRLTKILSTEDRTNKANLASDCEGKGKWHGLEFCVETIFAILKWALGDGPVHALFILTNFMVRLLGVPKPGCFKSG